MGGDTLPSSTDVNECDQECVLSQLCVDCVRVGVTWGPCGAACELVAHLEALLCEHEVLRGSGVRCGWGQGHGGSQLGREKAHPGPSEQGPKYDKVEEGSLKQRGGFGTRPVPPGSCQLPGHGQSSPGLASKGVAGRE